MDLDSAILYTRDISKIRNFYEHKICLKVDYQNKYVFVSFLFSYGARLGINKSVLKKVPGVQTFFIRVENIEEQYEKYKKLGFSFYEPFEKHDWGTYFAILDPDGNKIGFIQHPEM